MDAAPRRFGELPRDPELGVRVPFACGTPDFRAAGTGTPPTVRNLDGRRVTQCALSRVCGVCGAGLGRPLAFVGSSVEAGRNRYHFPACHLECARALLDEVRGLDVAVLGQAAPVTAWVLVAAAAFEFVRPGREDDDRRPTFEPNGVLSDAS